MYSGARHGQLQLGQSKTYQASVGLRKLILGLVGHGGSKWPFHSIQSVTQPRTSIILKREYASFHATHRAWPNSAFPHVIAVTSWHDAAIGDHASAESIGPHLRFATCCWLRFQRTANVQHEIDKARCLAGHHSCGPSGYRASRALR